jgi:hypothetical protein
VLLLDLDALSGRELELHIVIEQQASRLAQREQHARPLVPVTTHAMK